MNTIYLDTLFFTNCIIDYLTLLCAGKISGAVLNRFHIALAAVMGGLYACASIFSDFQWLTHPAVKLACGVLLCLVAFGAERHLWRCCITFLAVSAAFGGIFSALSFSSRNISYLPIDLKAFLLTFAGAYFILSLFFRQIYRVRRREIHVVKITFQGHTITFNALKDTGNELFDPISNAAVLVCEYQVLQPMFPQIDLTACQLDPSTVFSAANSLPCYTGKMRLIPFQTVSGQGLLTGFKPDSVFIDNEPQQLVIAMTDKKLSRDNTYQAIY